MQIRKTQPADIPAIMAIVEDARALFSSEGIPQWQNGYPGADTVAEDIRRGYGYVATDGGEVVGFCALIFGGEPDYAVIEDGEWRNDRPYLTVHRLGVRADRRGQGIGAALFSEAARLAVLRHVYDIRCDTHRKNKNMQHLVTKCGFRRCGIIHLRADGSERLAFHAVLDDSAADEAGIDMTGKPAEQ